MVTEKKTSEAWVQMPTNEEMLANVPKDRETAFHPYDFSGASSRRWGG